MSLLSTVRDARKVLSHQDQRSLALATVIAVVIAMLDMLAIALVLPLVTLASGGEELSGVGELFARLLPSSSQQTLLLALTVAVVVLFILKDLGAILFAWWLMGFRVIKRVELSTRLLGKFLDSTYTEVSRRSSAELLRTMEDAVIQFYGYTVFSLMRLVASAATLVAIAVALLVSAPLPSLALSAYLTLAAVFYLRVMRPRSQRAGVTAADASREAYQTAFAALGGMKEAKLRGSSGFFVGAYHDASMRGALALRTASFISELPRYLLEILFIIAVGAMLVIGVTAPTAGTGSVVGVIALFVAAGLRALPAVTLVLTQVSNMRFGARFMGVVIEEVQDGVVQAPEPAQPPARILPLRNELELHDVSFSYPEAAAPAVSSASITVPFGSTVAIVGRSGAGKTTLVDLLLGLHLPTQGRVTVDGVDIQEDLAGWQRGIGYVPQEIFLREASLAENVAFDQLASDIDPAKLRDALRRAQLEDLVDALEEGSATSVGERGSRLSGGQRQLIGIARALYHDPQLLILDEATSALDGETEHRVSEAIRELHGQITMVIVAHRLSTVRHVDTVVLVNGGEIEAVGTFDEVRRQSRLFARMVQLGSLD